MQRAVLWDFPNANISACVVWINMLPLDNLIAAKASARILHDPRVFQFHDPKKRVGKSIAQSLGGQEAVAWDIYLFYASGSEWQGNVPSPIHWAHQLSPSGWADHFHHGDDLIAELHRIMQQLMGG